MSTAEQRIYALWIEASAAVMIVGVFGSWATVGGTGVSGTSAGSRGWVVLTAAFLAAAILVFRRGTRSAGVYVAAIGIVAVAAVAYDRTHLGDAIGTSSATEAAARAGWGLNLALGASVSLTVAGLAWAVAMNRLPWSWLAPTAATGARHPSAIELAARDDEPAA